MFDGYHNSKIILSVFYYMWQFVLLLRSTYVVNQDVKVFDYCLSCFVNNQWRIDYRLLKNKDPKSMFSMNNIYKLHTHIHRNNIQQD
jgi:hypothetical protein